MVDVLDERPPSLARNDGKVYWIEITESQQKFKPHPCDAYHPDEARVTFEVNNYPKSLSSSSLKYQLMPILENRGVPQEVFVALLKADLRSEYGTMEAAMDDGLALRTWNQKANPISENRAQNGGIEMLAGLPDSNAEKLNWFVEVGDSTSSPSCIVDIVCSMDLSHRAAAI